MTLRYEGDFLMVSNQSRPLASRRTCEPADLKSLVIPSFQSIASPSEQERVRIKAIAFQFLGCFQSIASPSEQEIKTQLELYKRFIFVSNQSRPLASRRLTRNLNFSSVSSLFPINRVPQRVGDFTNRNCIRFTEMAVSNQSRPLASRRLLVRRYHATQRAGFQSIASPSEQGISLF